MSALFLQQHGNKCYIQAFGDFQKAIREFSSIIKYLENEITKSQSAQQEKYDETLDEIETR